MRNTRLESGLYAACLKIRYLQTAFDQARSIDTALKSAELYQTHTLASMNSHKVQKKVFLYVKMRKSRLETQLHG